MSPVVGTPSDNSLRGWSNQRTSTYNQFLISYPARFVDSWRASYGYPSDFDLFLVQVLTANHNTIDDHAWYVQRYLEAWFSSAKVRNHLRSRLGVNIFKTRLLWYCYSWFSSGLLKDGPMEQKFKQAAPVIRVCRVVYIINLDSWMMISQRYLSCVWIQLLGCYYSPLPLLYLPRFHDLTPLHTESAYTKHAFQFSSTVFHQSSLLLNTFENGTIPCYSLHP